MVGSRAWNVLREESVWMIRESRYLFIVEVDRRVLFHRRGQRDISKTLETHFHIPAFPLSKEKILTSSVRLARATPETAAQIALVFASTSTHRRRVEDLQGSRALRARSAWIIQMMTVIPRMVVRIVLGFASRGNERCFRLGMAGLRGYLQKFDLDQ